MGSILGIFNKTGEKLDRSKFNSAMKVLMHWEPEYSDGWIQDNVGLGINLATKPKSYLTNKFPYFDSNSGCCITADVRLDYKEELVRQLGISERYVASITDQELILISYLKYGQECVKHLFGDFAFIIWDSKKNYFFCGRDHFGLKPLLYYDSISYFICSTELSPFCTLEIPIHIIDEYCVNCAMEIAPKKSETAYRSIFKLAPAHTLIVKPGSKVEQKEYWNINSIPPNNKIEFNQAVDELRSRFINSIVEHTKGLEKLGIELSGGLDSSAIASVLFSNQKKDNQIVYTFTHSLFEDFKGKYFPFEDNTKYVELLNKQLNNNHQIYQSGYNKTGIVAAIENALEIQLSPIVHGIAMMTDLLIESADSYGVNVILSGFGGDEGISSHARGFYKELLDNKEYKYFYEQIKSSLNKNRANHIILIIKTLLKYYVPLISHLQSLFKIFDNRKCRYRVFPVKKEIIKHLNLKRKYFQQVGIPNDISFRDKQIRLITNKNLVIRLEEFFLIAQKRKIEYRYPFLDVKLIEFYFSLPVKFHKNKGFERYLFRCAMDNFLPHEICWKPAKTDVTIPSIQYRLFKDSARINSLIEDSRINNNYHYFDYKKLENILNKLILRNNGLKTCFGARVLYNPLSILILQKWQREGKINIGIKC